MIKRKLASFADLRLRRVIVLADVSGYVRRRTPVTMRRRLTATGCLLVLLLGAAGCGGNDENGAAEAISTAAETVAQALPESVTVELAEENSSGQSGTATLTPNEDGTFDVEIALSQGPSEPQPAHIHEGSCPDVGEIAAPLEDVVDGMSRTENVRISLEDLTSADSPGYAVNVHKSASELDEYVACGDITDVSVP
jgi:hypothetical protein